MKQPRKIPGILIYLLILFFSVSGFFYTINVYAEETLNQIVYEGDTASNNGVEVSKKIKKTELENYFDITLTVKTTTKVEEIKIPQDVAVVIVMDISNSMQVNNLKGSNTKRITEAKAAAKQFVEEFYKDSNMPKAEGARREIGFVAYATNAYEIYDLQSCKTKAERDFMLSEIDKIQPQTKGLRFTNMEAGLKRGNKMISKSDIKNKYVIFITDGLPTTYSDYKTDSTGYTGYDPQPIHPEYNGTNFPKEWTEGVFVNLNTKEWPYHDEESGGTNYSEHGAQTAEKEAKAILNKGIEMYTISIGMSNQSSLFDFRNKESHPGRSIDTDTEEHNLAHHNGTRIYSVAPGITDSLEEYFDKNTSSARKTELKKIWDTTSYYKKWLTEYMSSGSGYYYDSEQEGEILEAYAKIFEDITSKVEESSKAWIATDPMGVDGTVENIEFVGFIDDAGDLRNELKNNEENQTDTAKFNTAKSTIDWDLKESQYTTETKTEGTVTQTYYFYSLTYRIRLENEHTDFVENKDYETNEKTTLRYVTMVNNELSDPKEIDFPIPKVEGYLVNIQFTKNFGKFDNVSGGKLSGAKFKLSHDPACHCQQKDNFTNNVHMSSDKTYEATSDSNGLVKFTNVASGHKYILKEVEAPGDYNKSDATTYIEARYDQVIGTIDENDYINTIKKGNLKITKEVQGNKEYAKDFSFQIKVYHSNKTLTGDYTYVKIDADGNKKTETISLIKGEFTLADGESITIKGLPVGATYEITELTTNGYTVKHTINSESRVTGKTATCSSNSCSIDSKDTQEVNFYNIAGYILPATGDSGMLILIIIASLLIIGPIIDIGYMFYKYRKEDKLTS